MAWLFIGYEKLLRSLEELLTAEVEECHRGRGEKLLTVTRRKAFNREDREEDPRRARRDSEILKNLEESSIERNHIS
jgi:hypothetical protein